MAEVRGLSTNERALLLKLLSAEPFPGSAALLEQVELTRVVPQKLPTWLYLEVDDSAPIASTQDGPIPTQGYVTDPSGAFTGFVIVWVESGRLSALELPWVTPEMPTEVPPADRVSVRPPAR